MRTIDRAGQARRDRRPQRPACSPTASTPTRSSPIPRKSSDPDDGRAAGVRRARRLRRARAPGDGAGPARATRSSPISRARSRPTRRSASRRCELKGVGFVKESRRYYPKKELAAHVLGYVGLDNTGLAGLESTYDAQIRGREGKVLIQTDARRHALNSRVERPADRRRGARADDRSVPAVHRRARAARRRRREPRRRRHRDHHGSAHRRDPRAGELADVQPERVRPGRRRRAAQPRHPGPLRAGLDVQGRHRVGGARGARDRARRSDRLQPGLHHASAAASRSTTSTTTARCRSPTSSSSRATSARSRSGLRLGPERLGPLRQPLRLRPDARARTSAARTPASSGTRRG